MSSIALYTRKRFRDFCGRVPTVKDTEDFISVMTKLLKESRIPELRSINKKYMNFLDFLNDADLDKSLADLDSFTLSQALVTLGVLFSSRPSDFREAEERLNRGYKFCYFLSKAKLIEGKNQRSYAGGEDIDFGVIKGETLYRFSRSNGSSVLKLPMTPAKSQIDLTTIVKLVYSFTSRQRTCVNPVEVIGRELDRSLFKKTLITSSSAYYIVLRGKNAVLSQGHLLPQESMVLDWNISFAKDSRKKRKEIGSLTSERVTLLEDYIGLSLNVEGTKTPVYCIREGLFSPRDITFFAHEPNAFISEVSITLSNSLFKKSPGTLRINSIREALKYDLDSKHWMLYYEKRFVHMGFKTAGLSSSELDSESDDDIVHETIVQEDQIIDDGDPDDFFDPSDFDFAEHQEGDAFQVDVFDLPMTTTSIFVGSKLEVNKKSFKDMLVRSQLVILQAMVRGFLEPIVEDMKINYSEGTCYQSFLYLSRFCHDILTRDYEEYTGFVIDSFENPSGDPTLDNIREQKLDRFASCLIVYACASSFFEDYGKVAGRARDFADCCKELFNIFLPNQRFHENDCESYRLTVCKNSKQVSR